MALILAMVFMLIMALITVALGNLAVSELAGARSLDTGTRALAVADGAIERAVAFLKLAPDWSDTNNPLLKNLDTTGTNFKPMYDTVAAANATNQAFPVNSSFGTYTIEFKEVSTTNPNVNHDNIWVRALGTYGGVSRSIEAYVERLTPANVGGGAPAVYSAGSYSTATNGNGSTTFHGSAYFYSDALLKGGAGAGVYNDRAINIGDTAPYLNQLWVRGTLDTSKGNVNIGTSSQPMYGVHASHINNPSKNIYTDEEDNVVPTINPPNVAAYITCLNGGTCPSNVTVQSPGNVVSGSGTSSTTTICQKSGSTYSPAQVTNLAFSSTAFFIPTASNSSCASAPSGTNYMLNWDGAGNATLNTANDASPIEIPGIVTSSGNITYSGIGTIVVENVNSASNAVNTGNGQILSSSRASGTGTTNVLGCASTAASSMPTSDIMGFIVAGSVTLQGNSTSCNQENDVVMVVGRLGTSDTFAATSKVAVFGMVITTNLDTTQNPDFYQVPGLGNDLPAPIQDLIGVLSGSSSPQPVEIKWWHELTPQE